MPVYKDKRRGQWFAQLNYTDSLGRHKQVKSKYFDTRKEAQAELAEMTVKKKKTDNVTFNDVHVAYVEDQQKIVKPITATHYDPLFNHVKDLIGDIRVDKLTMAQYKEIKKEIDKKDLSTSRKNRIHKHICILCKYALINYDARCDVPEKCGGFKDPTKIEDDGLKYITEDQFKVFIEEVDDVVFKSLFTVLFYQGLRIGEALALTYNDIDLKNGKMKINKTYTSKINKDYKKQSYYITSPKTKNSNRTIPISKEALDALKIVQEYYMDYDKFKKTWFVFGGPYPLSETTIATKKDKAFKACGIDRITVHQFRHSCASYLFDHGVDPVKVQHFLGHSKLSTTMDIYVHLKQDKLNDIFDFTN